MPMRGSVLLTGANGAIGRSLVSQFSAKLEYVVSYHAIYVVRNESSARELQAFVKGGTQHSYEVVTLELSRLTDVRAFAQRLNDRVNTQQVPPLRAIVLNAGFLELTTQTWTPDDGFDMSFASSYLGHWLLTLMLLQSMDRDMGRVVVVGSSVHDTQNPHNNLGGQYRDPKWSVIFHDSTDQIAYGLWSTNEDDPSFRSGYRRYGAAKLCQVMMIPELQRRLDCDDALRNMSVLGIDPGTTPSGITRRGGWVMHVLVNHFIMRIIAFVLSWFWDNAGIRSNQKSAKDILSAMLECNAVLGERPKGLYLDGDELVEMGAEARDPVKTGILWKDTLRYTGLTASETILKELE